MRGLVPGTSPLKSLQKRTGCRDLSRKQFKWSVLRNKLRGLMSQKFKLVWNHGTICRDQSLVPPTRFWSKNGQFTWWDLSPRLLLQGLVAGTNLLVCQPYGKKLIFSLCRYVDLHFTDISDDVVMLLVWTGLNTCSHLKLLNWKLWNSGLKYLLLFFPWLKCGRLKSLNTEHSQVSQDW